MNVKETAVTNAANLSFFMVNFSYALLQPFRQTQPDYSVLDLKVAVSRLSLCQRDHQNASAKT